MAEFLACAAGFLAAARNTCRTLAIAVPGGAARRVSRAYAGVLACISRQNGSNLDGFVMTF
jgi:hypothetical protein